MQARVLEFIDALRAAKVRASVAESLDAVQAVAAAGVERESLRAALAASLVKDIGDRPAFDALFERFFAAPGAVRSRGQPPRPVAEGVGRGWGESDGIGRPRPDPEPEAEAGKPRDESLRPRETEAQRRARQRVVVDTPFEEMDSREVEEAEALLADLARRWHAHLRRRLHRAARGRLDFRRTLRAALATGGVPVQPVFRQRRPGKLDLVALCDLSHSTATAADFCLALLAPATGYFRRARLFGYVDHPVEVSIEGGHIVPHAPLDLAARSDFGRVLTGVWDQHDRLLTRNTLLLILGDARNNRRPPRADLLSRMHQRVRRIVWLNPEPVMRWNTGDSVLAGYAPHCDTVLGASTLRALLQALREAF